MNYSNSKLNDNRGIVAFISPYMINNIDIKNPYVIAWWSAAFPGFGHLILGHYIIGFMLVMHEMIINTLSGLNTAIYYSMIGDFQTAMEKLDTRWLLAYMSPYIFSIWDSYRRTIQQNEDYVIAQQIGYKIVTKDISAFGLNKLDHKKPIVAVLWSFLAPGAGHLYINRTPIAFMVPWFVLVVYFSNVLPAAHFTLLGDFEKASNCLDPQWLLYLPSHYGFIVYDAYLHTLEFNKIYKMQQKRLLEEIYQNQNFPINSFKISKEK